MKRLMTITIVSLLIIVGSVESATSLTGTTYSYDIAAGTGDITTISFDYSYGATNPITPAFRIRRLKDDGTDSWLGSFNIHTSSFNLDTDFGPYSNSEISLSGENHYEFTLDRSNGLWDLKVNGTEVDFVALSSTNAIQPDGYAVTAGQVIENKFFSDESDQAIANALALGYPYTTYTGYVDESNPGVGIGGTGAYRLFFTSANGGYVDNIQVTNVPEPASLALLGLGGLCFRRKRA